MIKKFFNHPYIATKYYDLVFFLLAPVIATVLGSGSYWYFSSTQNKPAMEFVLYLGVAVTNFHLVLVFYRSHGNKDIFKLYPYRFTLVPLLLFLSISTSSEALYFALLLSTLWDAYHSAMQVFGIGRIYDHKLNNPPRAGRRMDIILNLTIHFAPILIGVTAENLSFNFLTTSALPGSFTDTLAQGLKGLVFILKPLAWPVYVAVVGLYVYHYRRLKTEGYRLSNYKVWLLLSVALTRLFVWSFSSLETAWLSLNVFHAIQYFGIVWWHERSRISSLYGLPQKLAVFVFVTTAMMYGLYVANLSNVWAMRVAVTVALIHYWYDGFIWSTQKKQV